MLLRIKKMQPNKLNKKVAKLGIKSNKEVGLKGFVLILWQI
jgi:hypothetical protein